MSNNEAKSKKTVLVVLISLVMLGVLGILAFGPNLGLNSAQNFVILNIPRIVTTIDSASTEISHHAEADFSIMISGSSGRNLNLNEIRDVIEEALSDVEHDEIRATGDIEILSRLAHEALIREFPDIGVDRVLIRNFVFYFMLPGSGS